LGRFSQANATSMAMKMHKRLKHIVNCLSALISLQQVQVLSAIRSPS
jgi:hypothetical protein